MKKLLTRGLPLLLVAVLAVAGARAALLRHPPSAPVAATALPIDKQAVAQRLAAAVRFATISREAVAGQEEAATPQLPELLAYLRATYPRVFSRLETLEFSGQGVLLRWTGRDAAAEPALLAAHLDVVPVESGTESRWQHAPFSGDIAGGYIWGRGTLDDKNAALAMLEAAEAMLAANQQPPRTLYLALGGDEEIGGEQGAKQIAAQLRRQGVKLEYVLDEGQAVTDGFIGGLTKPAALIGVGQKGYATFVLSASGPGGHSSIPEDDNPLVRLSRAVQRIADTPPPTVMTEPLRLMLHDVAPDATPAMRVALGNLWLTQPIVERVLLGKPATRALLQTVVSPTVFRAGEKDNVIPQQARAEINVRLLPGDSVEQVRARFRQLIGDERVKLEVLPGATEPAPVSDSRGPSYLRLAGAIHAVYPDVAVAPALVLGLTDSRHYVDLARNIYRFGAMRLTPEDLARIHGSNERIGVDDYADAVRFFATLMAAP